MTQAQLAREIQKVAQQGYALSAEESVNGQAAIAAPILQDGAILAVVNLSIPLPRATKRAIRQWVPMVVGAAKAKAISSSPRRVPRQPSLNGGRAQAPAARRAGRA